MRRSCGWWVVGALMLGGCLPLALLALGGISARSAPTALEAFVARRVRSLAIPSAAAQARNPLAASPRMIEDGMRHFADHCATCHANDGSGRTEMGQALYPRAPDMRASATQNLTDGELFYIVENGVRLTGMPAWGAGGKPEESWKLVHFIRHLPALTSDEQAEMRELNPRSGAEWKELLEEREFLRGEGSAQPDGQH